MHLLHLSETSPTRPSTAFSSLGVPIKSSPDEEIWIAVTKIIRLYQRNAVCHLRTGRERAMDHYAKHNPRGHGLLCQSLLKGIVGVSSGLVEVHELNFSLSVMHTIHSCIRALFSQYCQIHLILTLSPGRLPRPRTCVMQQPALL
jgi:hypothetical protein